MKISFRNEEIRTISNEEKLREFFLAEYSNRIAKGNSLSRN
jgi:hypothetical protein